MSANGSELRRRFNSDHKSTKDDLLQDAETQLKRFIETNGHFSLVRYVAYSRSNFHLADAFTLMNGFCGAQSIYMSGRFLVTSDPKYIWYALWFPFFGAIFDFLDGKIARWRRSSSMLGQELDSLADSISFGVAPTVAAFALGLRYPLDTLWLTVFVCAGVARLARFNITAANVPHDAYGKARYFEGLPIPSSLALVGGMALCLLFGRFEDSSGPWQPTKSYPFTGVLAQWLDVQGADGVPLGLFTLDFSLPLYKLLTLGDILPQFVSSERLAEFSYAMGYFAMHKISLLFMLWSMAMVSKTLHVPKP